jgi:hypothetical protein
LTELQKTNFIEQLHTRFQVEYAPGQLVELELVEVREGRSSARQEVFAPTFQGPRDFYLPQGLYVFHQPVMEQFDLFIVPIGQDEHGFYYEAVFNRLISTGD